MQHLFRDRDCSTSQALSPTTLGTKYELASTSANRNLETPSPITGKNTSRLPRIWVISKLTMSGIFFGSDWLGRFRIPKKSPTLSSIVNESRGSLMMFLGPGDLKSRRQYRNGKSMPIIP